MQKFDPARRWLGPRKPKERAPWKRLKAKLLALGGERVLWQGADDYMEDLLTSGRVCAGAVSLRKMERNACHANAACLWAADPQNVTLWRGYGLGGGGEKEVWRMHSWAMQRGKLIETTVKRVCYYGVPLTGSEALHFWLSAYLLVGKTHLDEEAREAAGRFPKVLPLIAEAAAGRRNPQCHDEQFIDGTGI